MSHKIREQLKAALLSLRRPLCLLGYERDGFFFIVIFHRIDFFKIVRIFQTILRTYNYNLHIQIPHTQCILFNKRATRFDHITHQRGEYLVRADSIFDTNFEQDAVGYIHSGFP